MKSLRYLFRRLYQNWSKNWGQTLHDEEFMTDDKFHENFRMDRDFILKLLIIVQDDPVFKDIFEWMN